MSSVPKRHPWRARPPKPNLSLHAALRLSFNNMSIAVIRTRWLAINH